MRNDLHEVLVQLQIKTVYWVDDDNVKTADMDVQKLRDQAVAIIIEQGSAPIRNVIGKMPDSWRVELGKLQKQLERDEKLDTRPNRSDMIEEKLDALVNDAEDSLADLTLLLESVDGQLSKNEKAALASLFKPKEGARGYAWKKLSFTDWEKQEAAILKAHSPQKPALILLDQQNTRDKSSLDGTAILKNVCGNEAHRRSFKFLVVTNTSTVEGEFEHSVELAQKIELGPLGIGSPLFTVAKARITRAVNDKAGEGPSLESHFVSLLRRLRLSMLNQQLTALAKNVIAEATERAFNRLTEITLHEFMYAVTQSSQIEGVSELDTLLRLLAIEQRDAMLNKVVKSRSLRKAIEKIRDIPVEIRKEEISKRTDLTELRGREIYWPEQAVNRLHQPVAAGDIFEVKSGKSKDYYVVLGNDCDLMLRGTGTRNSVLVLLAKLEEAEGKADKDTDVTLQCPLPQNPALVRVPMNKFISAHMDILDLCWLNSNGACVWKKSADHQALHILKSQKKRAAILREKLSSAASFEQIVSMAPFAFKRMPGPTSEKVDFKLRRAGRMNTPYAQGILTKFAMVFARPSYEHNYSDVQQFPKAQ